MSELLRFTLWLLLGVAILGAAAYCWERWANRKVQR